MSDLVLTWLNAGERDEETNAPVASAFIPLDETGTDESQRTPVGTVALMNCLGVIGMPAAPDQTGHAEAIIVTDIGGTPGVCVAARDSRSYSLAGNMKPGDTILHSTGPNKASQVQCKEEKRQLVLATKKPDGQQMILMLDGKNKKFQLLVNGALIQVDDKGAIDMTSPNGKNGITISNDQVWIHGKVHFNGVSTPVKQFMVGPQTGSPGGAASVPLFAAMGITYGE